MNEIGGTVLKWRKMKGWTKMGGKKKMNIKRLPNDSKLRKIRLEIEEEHK